MSQIPEKLAQEAAQAVRDYGLILLDNPRLTRVLREFQKVLAEELSPYFDEIASGEHILALQAEISSSHFLQETRDLIELVKKEYGIE